MSKGRVLVYKAFWKHRKHDYKAKIHSFGMRNDNNNDKVQQK